MKPIIFAVSALLIFSQCTKKNAEVMTSASTTVDNSWRKMAPGPAAARDIKLGNYSSFDLANGLKVIVVENHKLPRVSYQLSFNNDPLVEGEKSGYVSFAGDLISKGTTTKTKAQIDETIDYIGASLSTSSTGIFASSLKKHTPKLLEVMTDVLMNPVFPKDEFEKMRKRMASNLVSAKTNPEAIAENIKSVVNFGEKHPYGEVTSEETLKNITVDDCKKYVNTYFKPNNAYLVVVGDITLDEAKSQAEKYFSSWKRGDIPSATYPNPVGPMGAQVRFGNKDGAVQSVINISYPIVMKPGQDDAIKASVMNSILGGGIFSGRLMQNLREKKAYTYGARSSLSNDKLAANFNAFASVRNEVTDSSVTEFIYEMNRMVNEPVTEKDLQLVKNSMTGNFARSLESPQTIANFALNTFQYQLPKDYYNNYLKNLELVSVADVQEMAKKYIRPENCNIVVVGNKDNVADKLKKFDSDGKVDFYDPYGKKMEEKKIELSGDITASSVITDYLEALGGTKALNAVKELHTTMTASIQGQPAQMEMFQSIPDKFAMKMSMMGMTVQEQKFDGTKGMNAQMGQKQPVTDPSELAGLKKQATIFEQLSYFDPKYKLELKGIEDIDGQNCYKIVVTNPGGETQTEFYNVKSNLLSRIVKSEGIGENVNTIVTDFKDYKVVNDVQFPHGITINGAAPFTLEFVASLFEVNKGIPAETFKVE